MDQVVHRLDVTKRLNERALVENIGRHDLHTGAPLDTIQPSRGTGQAPHLVTSCDQLGHKASAT